MASQEAIFLLYPVFSALGLGFPLLLLRMLQYDSALFLVIPKHWRAERRGCTDVVMHQVEGKGAGSVSDACWSGVFLL